MPALDFVKSDKPYAKPRLKCRMHGCSTYKQQRFGLCNKHRKWVEKGLLDVETLEILGAPKKIGSYSGQVCKFPGCDKKPRRNFLCPKHSGMVVRGTLDPKTLQTNYKRYKRNLTNGCYACFNKNASIYVKGFCKKCYGDYKKGFIDYFGTPTDKKKKRVQKYSDENLCKVAGCGKKARSAGFCHNHYGSYKYHGTFDSTGKRLSSEKNKNKGYECINSKCKNEAYCKMLCKKHYVKLVKNNKIKDGLLKIDRDGFDPFAFD
jgi:hypothetical protein